MHILILHQYFPKSSWTGGHRFWEFAKFWTKEGHSISIVAGSQHYLSTNNTVRSPWLDMETPWEGITVYRCFMVPSYNKNICGRTISYISFSLNALLSVIKIKRPDVIISTSPPLTIAIPAIFAKIYHKAPLIFEVRDLWLESAIDLGILRNPLLIWLIKKVEQVIYNISDCVNVLTPAFWKNLRDEKGVHEDKLCFIPNGADPKKFIPESKYNEIRRHYGWREKTVFLYTGAIGKANNLLQLVKVADRLRDNHNLQFVVIGEGLERPLLEKEIQNRGLKNLNLLNAVPRDTIASFIQACDVGIAILKPIKIFTTVYPNKIFDYMSCARPTLCVINGVARELIEKSESGQFARPGDIKHICKNILFLANNPKIREKMGIKGRNYVIKHFNREILAKQYLNVAFNLISREIV